MYLVLLAAALPLTFNILISKNRHVVRKSFTQHHRQRQIKWQVLVIERPLATLTVAIHHLQVAILNNAVQNIYHHHISYHHHHHRQLLHHPCANSFLMRLAPDAKQSVSIPCVSLCDDRTSVRVFAIKKFAHFILICISTQIHAHMAWIGLNVKL